MTVTWHPLVCYLPRSVTKCYYYVTISLLLYTLVLGHGPFISVKSAIYVLFPSAGQNANEAVPGVMTQRRDYLRRPPRAIRTVRRTRRLYGRPDRVIVFMIVINNNNYYCYVYCSCCAIFVPCKSLSLGLEAVATRIRLPARAAQTLHKCLLDNVDCSI